MKVFFLLLFFPLFVFAESHLRLNLLGYRPVDPKRILVMSDTDNASVPWTLKDSTGKTIRKGILTQKVLADADNLPMKYNFEILLDTLRQPGSYLLELPPLSLKTDVKVIASPYSFLLSDVLLYLKSQRCGTELEPFHGPCHFGDQKLPIFRHVSGSVRDFEASGDTIDLKGGWHDAGDYIKFTQTTAHATYFLLRSWEESKALDSVLRKSILDEAKWGLKYLASLMNIEGHFILQVADQSDHDIGQRLPENDELDGKRKAYSGWSAPQLAFSSAALSLGSKLLRESGDSGKSAVYLSVAKRMLDSARSHDDLSIAQNEWMYHDLTPDDNLALAAIELFRATGEAKFYDEAVIRILKTEAKIWSSWRDEHVFTYLRILQTREDAKVRKRLRKVMDGFLENAAKNYWGLTTRYVWASLHTWIQISSDALLAERDAGLERYRDIWLRGKDYLFGWNNWGISFIATKAVPAFSQPHAQVFSRQQDLFPAGAFAEGPVDRETFEQSVREWGNHGPKPDPFENFQTPAAVFNDYRGDYSTAEPTIGGQADVLFFLVLMEGS